jgi:hypothetical protein
MKESRADRTSRSPPKKTMRVLLFSENADNLDACSIWGKNQGAHAAN